MFYVQQEVCAVRIFVHELTVGARRSCVEVKSHSPWKHLRRCRSQCGGSTHSLLKGPETTPLSCPCLGGHLWVSLEQPGGSLYSYIPADVTGGERSGSRRSCWSWLREVRNRITLKGSVSIRLSTRRSRTREHKLHANNSTTHTTYNPLSATARTGAGVQHAWANASHTVKKRPNQCTGLTAAGEGNNTTMATSSLQDSFPLIVFWLFWQFAQMQNEMCCRHAQPILCYDAI